MAIFARHQVAENPRVVEAGQFLLRVTGHGELDGPWVPVGPGIHTCMSWVGSMSGTSGAAADFTALGDNMNIAARLAFSASQAEIIASEAACHASGIVALQCLSIARKVDQGVLHLKQSSLR